MLTQADYTEDEWNTLLQAPAFAILFIIQADHYSLPARYHKLFIGIKAILETAAPNSSSDLIRAVREAIDEGQRPKYPAAFPHNLAEARQLALEGCGKAARLLAQKAPATEADAYSHWLISIGQLVANTSDEPIWPGQNRVEGAERIRTALDILTYTLQVG